MVDSSPRPIAASHVLHRLLVPRHPPFALGNLTTKMLASTVQFSNNNQPQPRTNAAHTPTQEAVAPHGIRKTQRNQAELVPSGPNRVSTTGNQPHPPPFPPPRGMAVLGKEAVAGTDSPVSPPMSTPHRHPRQAGSSNPLRGEALLRKEVIQPHLPVRLPCYDFVPIASPTFDGSPHKG